MAGASSRIATIDVPSSDEPRFDVPRSDVHRQVEGDHLAWGSPREAEGALSAPRKRRLTELRARLHGSWRSAAPHLEAAAALASLDPRSSVCMFPGAPAGGPRWVAQTITEGAPSEARVRNQELMPRARSYALRGPDPFADRPVALAVLLRRSPPGAADALERLLRSNGVAQQLRMVLYDQGAATLFAGLYRPARELAFDAEDHALLLAARPALRQWSRVAAAVGQAPLGDGALAATLNALDRPALLIRRGRALFANPAGSALLDDVLAWDRAGRPAGFADAAPLLPGGMQVDLVLPFASPPSRPGLSPALRRVADLLGEGLSDKEIAARLGMPLSTVRTYVTRVFARTGVRTRRELMPR